MLAMLMFVTLVMKDHVLSSSESQFYEQLFRRTFYQDNLNKDRDHPTRQENPRQRSHELNRTAVIIIVPKNITEKIRTEQKTIQEKETHEREIHSSTILKPRLDVKQECTDIKKCRDHEVDFMDREDHNTQLVEEMFVNTDDEITSIQGKETDLDIPSLTFISLPVTTASANWLKRQAIKNSGLNNNQGQNPYSEEEGLAG